MASKSFRQRVMIFSLVSPTVPPPADFDAIAALFWSEAWRNVIAFDEPAA